MKNSWGIIEPDEKTPALLDVNMLDIILIPLLIFDKKGNRVGYGKGFYDRFLANTRPDALKIGLSFFEAIDCIEDTNPYDIKLDYCLTPNKVWEFV